MGKDNFHKSSLQTARDSLKGLFEGYSVAANIPVTVVSEIVADDRAFVYRIGRSSLSFSTFDRVVGRFSWLWPADVAWPAGVPRVAPERPSEKALRKLRERQEKQGAASETPTLPGDAAWPDDIPAPGRPVTPTSEARDG